MAVLTYFLDFSVLEITMAFPLPRGVTASEIAFLAEMETVTIVPRQRLEGLELLGVSYSRLFWIVDLKLIILGSC